MGSRSDILDDREGPSLQNPDPVMEQGQEGRDADMDAAANLTSGTTMAASASGPLSTGVSGHGGSLGKDENQIVNELCRLSFALGCGPMGYQQQVQQAVRRWEDTITKE